MYAFSSVATFFSHVCLLAFQNASLRLKSLPFLCSSAETQARIMKLLRLFTRSPQLRRRPEARLARVRGDSLRLIAFDSDARRYTGRKVSARTVATEAATSAMTRVERVRSLVSSSVKMIPARICATRMTKRKIQKIPSDLES